MKIEGRKLHVQWRIVLPSMIGLSRVFRPKRVCPGPKPLLDIGLQLATLELQQWSANWTRRRATCIKGTR